jgi:hypothetical protein
MRQPSPSTVGVEIPVPASREEALAYVGAMLTELQKIAARYQCDTLAYVIEMARLEAEMRR